MVEDTNVEKLMVHAHLCEKIQIIHNDKGQLISKCLFWYLQFSQKMNKKI